MWRLSPRVSATVLVLQTLADAVDSAYDIHIPCAKQSMRYEICYEFCNNFPIGSNFAKKENWITEE